MKGGFFPFKIAILEKPQTSIIKQEKIKPFQDRTPSIYLRIYDAVIQEIWSHLVFLMLSQTQQSADLNWCLLLQPGEGGCSPSAAATVTRTHLPARAPSFSPRAQASTSAYRPVCRRSSASTEDLLRAELSL